MSTLEIKANELKYNFVKYYFLMILLKQFFMMIINFYFDNLLLFLIDVVIIAVVSTLCYIHFNFSYDFERLSRASCILFLIFDLIYGAFSQGIVFFIFLNSLLFPWVFYLFFNIMKTFILTSFTLLIFPLNAILNYYYHSKSLMQFHEYFLTVAIVVFDLILLFIILYYYTEISRCNAILFFVNKEEASPSEVKFNELNDFDVLHDESTRKIFEKIDHYMLVAQPWRDAEYSLEQLAKDLNLSTFQISTSINYFTKSNFKSYLNNYRLNAFVEEMKNRKRKDILFKEVFLDLGFNSRVTFNRNFKNKFGKTPQEYLLM